MKTLKFKKIFSLIMTVCIVLTLFSAVPFSASAETKSGTTGDCTWTLDGTHLTISGNGEMEYFSFNNQAPWTKLITSVTIEKGVTNIGNCAFSNCTELVSVNIPDSVTSIGKWAFESCRSLLNITVPNSVTNIDESAFMGCQKLTSVSLSDNITAINDGIFASCLALTSIIIPDGVTSIGDWAFESCRSLTSMTIPGSVTKIGDNAFECAKIEDVYFTGDFNAWCNIDFTNSNPAEHASNLYINGKLIEGAIELPNGITKIGAFAFSGCSNTTSITIPDGVTSIGNSAFYSCTKITSITLPGSLINIGENALNYYYIKDIYYTGDLSNWCNIDFGSCAVGSATNLYINGKLLEGDIKIPADVKKIGNSVFENCNKLTSITIQYGAEKIGDRAFSNCTELASIDIPNSVTDIGNYAFSNCTKLANVAVPDGVTDIGGCAFLNCASLTSINIPDSVTSINSGTFSDCTKLANIVMSKNLKNIGSGAFENCPSLKNITVPNSVTSIGEAAFYNTAFYNDKNNWQDEVLYIGNHLIEADKDVVKDEYSVKQGTKCIADASFKNCENLQKVIVPDSVTTIGNSAFLFCSKLTDITIGNGVEDIGNYAFEYCRSLKNITMPDNVTHIGIDAFSQTGYADDYGNWLNDLLYIGNHLIRVNKGFVNGNYSVNKGTKCISDMSFSECKNLKSVIIPDGVTGIGCDAFSYCTELTSITIPDSVTNIGKNAFKDCDNLVITTFEGSFAHKYAVDNSINYKLVEPGDANCDGVIDLNDAISAARADVGNAQIFDSQIKIADVNGDEKVTVHDALLIVRFSLGLIDKFPKVK